MKKQTPTKLSDIIPIEYVHYTPDAPQELLVNYPKFFSNTFKEYPLFYEFQGIDADTCDNIEWVRLFTERMGDDFFGITTSEIAFKSPNTNSAIIRKKSDEEIEEEAEEARLKGLVENTASTEVKAKEIVDLLVSFDGKIFVDTTPYKKIYISFHPDYKEKLDQVMVDIKKFVDERNISKDENSSFIYILKKVGQSYEFHRKDTTYVDFNDELLELSYGKEFLKFHEGVESFFEEKRTNKGLMFLYGKAGTGKTWYIRNLIAQYAKYNIVYIPTTFANYIGSPDFQGLIDQSFPQGATIIIEDAEAILRDRDQHGSNNVSSILQITDGLMADVSTHRIIATFNTDKENIDKALMRQGRLHSEHYFDELSMDSAKALAKYLGKDPDMIKNSLTLADVYDLESYEAAKAKGSIKKKASIGFGA
jgi:ATPase family associated with various cellular activities (AAA)